MNGSPADDDQSATPFATKGIDAVKNGVEITIKQLNPTIRKNSTPYYLYGFIIKLYLE